MQGPAQRSILNMDTNKNKAQFLSPYRMNEQVDVKLSDDVVVKKAWIMAIKFDQGGHIHFDVVYRSGVDERGNDKYEKLHRISAGLIMPKKELPEKDVPQTDLGSLAADLLGIHQSIDEGTAFFEHLKELHEQQGGYRAGRHEHAKISVEYALAILHSLKGGVSISDKIEELLTIK